jgi:2'-5' RNA ligase
VTDLAEKRERGGCYNAPDAGLPHRALRTTLSRPQAPPAEQSTPPRSPGIPQGEPRILNTLRAFIAVDLPPDVRTQLDALTGRLRCLPGQECMRFVASSGIHLTLKFLGEISPESATDIHDVLKDAASSMPGFTVRIRGVGCFPSSRQPRVLWVGLDDPRGMLQTLQRAIEAGCARLKLPAEDRPFSPHLTLGRVRREAGAGAGSFVRAALEREQALDLGEMAVDAVHLFRSDLRPSGAIYSRLHSAALGGGT